MQFNFSKKALRVSYLCLSVSLLMPSLAMAQSTPSTPSTPTVTAPNIPSSSFAPASTIIPTDTLPLPAVQNRMTFAENFQLRILQKLPARFYFNSTVETSFRDETNPFQFPKKESLMRQLPQPQIWAQLSASNQQSLYNTIGLVARNDAVFRVLPNVTAGWTVTPRTRIYGNYFMIRDQLAHEIRINTVIHNLGYGIQHDIPMFSNGNLQLDMQARQLYQLHQRSVFDFLPGLTFSKVLTPRSVFFANALLQMRGYQYFTAPTKEIDPFYTWGALYQKNGWTFSASTTFVQNFRAPFRAHATIPVSNYSFISDFEIARRVIKQLPGLQAFVRAEPIWNFHGKDRPGLSGMDFRLFFGLRMSIAKPALTSALENLRQQLEEQETEPPEKKDPSKEQKPSAFIPPHELIASSPQPIHGFLDEETGESKMPSEFANNQMNPALGPGKDSMFEPSVPAVAAPHDLNDQAKADEKEAGPIGMATPTQEVAATPVSFH